jgi:hypothetical protein
MKIEIETECRIFISITCHVNDSYLLSPLEYTCKPDMTILYKFCLTYTYLIYKYELYSIFALANTSIRVNSSISKSVVQDRTHS